MSVHTQAAADLHEPPPPARRVLIVGLTGVGLAAAAFVIGLATSAPLQGYEPHKADGPRALLASLGLLVAGCAVSMRPGWYGGWLCGAAAGLIGYGFGASPPAGTEWYVAPPRDWYAGLPNSWDSVQLFFGVAGMIGLIGAAWTRLPWRATLALILTGMAFHFAGILSAITSPPPTPPVTDQYWRRVAREYLMFAYMNNAYQFYSPDPGPASELWVCVKYMRPGAGENDPDAEKEYTWVYIPYRARDYKDPLGLEYYRRLSLTENASQFHRSGYYLPAAEADLLERRRAADDTRIPRYGRSEIQRLVPIDLVARHVLPSYARHFAKQYARESWEVRGVKIYRTQHTIITPDQFVGFDSMTNKRVDPWGPYNASLYMPYYQGEFDPKGNLKDPQDHLLYWLVPIVPVRTPPTSRAEYERTGGFKAYFIDYVSVHAGYDRFTARPEPKTTPQGPGTGAATGGRP